jgi:hypothetical protein
MSSAPEPRESISGEQAHEMWSTAWRTRLLWTARSYGAGDGELESARRDYVKILFAWNDQLNTNLSLVGTYFGDDARAVLEGLYEDFARIGRQVEAVVRAAESDTDDVHLHSQLGDQFEGRQAGSLNDRVYQFGLRLMTQLREGKVGRYAPDKAYPS